MEALFTLIINTGTRTVAETIAHALLYADLFPCRVLVVLTLHLAKLSARPGDGAPGYGTHPRTAASWPGRCDAGT